MGLAQDIEAEVNAARKVGVIHALLAMAVPAVDRLLAAAQTARDADQISILQTAKRIGYNTAADVWPGWEIGTPPRTPAELAAALDLAHKSSAIVARLA